MKIMETAAVGDRVRKLRVANAGGEVWVLHYVSSNQTRSNEGNLFRNSEGNQFRNIKITLPVSVSLLIAGVLVGARRHAARRPPARRPRQGSAAQT